MNTIGLGVLLTALLGPGLLTGCGEAHTRTGQIVGQVMPYTEGRLLGSQFPDIVFADQEGESHRLSSLYADATILALIEKPCASADSPLVVGTSEFGWRITVVEITTPPGGCEAHKQGVMTRAERGGHLVSLCDGGGLVRRWLGLATPDAVVVLDRYGRVVASGRMTDFAWLRRRAIDSALEAHPATGERWEEWLGFTISKETSAEFLSKIGSVDPLGENGEFHTLVLECPLYGKSFKVKSVERKAAKGMAYLNVSIV